MASRNTQDISLVIAQSSTAAARVSQDISLVIASPSTTKVRLSQDVQLVVMSNTKPISQQPNTSVIN